MDTHAMKSAGCPNDVADKIAAHPKAAALGSGFLSLLVMLAQKFGPGIFTAVLDWLNGTTPTP